MVGGVPPPWPPMIDNSKPWDYYSRRDDKRDKDRERPRERTHEREREREHSPSAMSYTRYTSGTKTVVNGLLGDLNGICKATERDKQII